MLVDVNRPDRWPVTLGVYNNEECRVRIVHMFNFPCQTFSTTMRLLFCFEHPIVVI